MMMNRLKGYMRVNADKVKNASAILGIVTLGFVIRVLYLKADSYWCDESYSIDFCYWGGPLFKHYLIVRPLYFLILKGWINLFGDGEFQTRFLSVIVGTLSILVLYKLARLFLNARVALFSALVFALSLFHCIWSRTAMNYSLFALLSMASSYYFLNYLRLRKDSDLYLCVAVTVLSIFTHPFTLFLILVQNIVVFVSRNRSMYRKWLAYQLIIAIFIAILCYFLIVHSPLNQINEIFNVSKEEFVNPINKTRLMLFDSWKVWESFTFGGRLVGHGGVGFPVSEKTLPLGYALLFIYTVLIFLGLKKMSTDMKKESDGFIKSSHLYIILCLFVPLLLVFIANFWINPLMCERYFIFNYFSFVIIGAIGLCEGITLKWCRRFLFMVVLVLSIIYLGNLYVARKYQTWRDIGTYMKNNVQDTDAIVLIPFCQVTSFWYYFKGEDKNSLRFMTKDGIYSEGKWLHEFIYEKNIVLGNDFKKIDSFIEQEYFKKLYSQKRNVWLIMSPFWEHADRAAQKVYATIDRYYKQAYSRYYPYNGVLIEKWIISQ